MQNELTIAGVTIIQDDHGRYNLNALHQASEQASDHHKTPGEWLKRKSTRAVIHELKSQVVNSPLEVLHGGEYRGTYAHEILAVEYAGWISPAFRIKVNQAFIDSRTKPSQATFVDQYPELKAIQDLVVSVAMYRQEQDILRAAQQRTQEVADKAVELSHMALRGQQWLTIRQYVLIHDLHRQMPLKTQQDYARWLGGYCLEKGFPMYKAQTADKAWQDERTYYIGAINDTLPAWLKRNQMGLTLVKETHE